MSQMERSVSVKEVNGIIVAARRYRLKKVACAVVGAVFLCLAGAGGYLIYRKVIIQSIMLFIFRCFFFFDLISLLSK